jgi:hypothetical protein
MIDGRMMAAYEPRKASWSATVLWRFGEGGMNDGAVLVLRWAGWQIRLRDFLEFGTGEDVAHGMCY